MGNSLLTFAGSCEARITRICTFQDLLTQASLAENPIDILAYCKGAHLHGLIHNHQVGIVHDMVVQAGMTLAGFIIYVSCLSF